MRTRLALPFASLAVLALAACAAPPGGTSGTPEDEAAIRAVADQYAAAYAARDTAAMGQLVTEDYEVVDPTGKHQQGRAAFVQAIAQEFAMMPAGASLSATTTFVRWVDATHAVAGGTWAVTPAMPGMPNQGSWLAVMTKEDTTWRMMSGMGAPDMTAMMPADTARK